ncbi:MAG TPA: NAD(P)/FAD-dependent oxidoreductase [Acidobacteriota bacterium]|nr:NAD(P)/FAD-dependent oxidoreductase [Acidobacteriota bacterium]
MKYSLMASDVLVLGAGPAGISVSLLLACQGYSVEILDPAFFPREKICGEFLNPQAARWLDEQGLTGALLSLDPFRVYGMKITDSRGRSFTGHYANHKEHSGFAVMRRSFDQLLVTQARAAGIQICEGWKAERLVFDGADVCGAAGRDAEHRPFEKRARIVIGADGRNNLIGRTFGWIRGIRSLRKYAYQTYYEVPDLSHFGEVHMVREGYVGIAPLNEKLANVALVIDEKGYPGGDADRAQFLQGRIGGSPLRARFTGLKPVAPVNSGGPLAFTSVRVSGHRALLVGDTCGFIDPFTGEGINYAFLSSSLATDVIHQAFQTGRFDDASLARYDRMRREVFSRKFMMSRLLQHAIGSTRLSSYLVRKCAERMDLADTMVSAVGSAVPVEHVWSLRFLLKLVFS